jgi:SPOR domain
MTVGSRRETVTSDLVRRRQSRDLWISRGHLYAMVVLLIISAATSFVIGFVLGRDAVPAPLPAADVAPADEELVRVLSNIERATHPSGVELVGAPGALERAPAAPTVASDAPAPTATALVTSAPPQNPEGYVPPADHHFTVVAGEGSSRAELEPVGRALAERGLHVWYRLSVVDGAPRFRVAIASYATSEEAALALPVLRAAGYEGRVAPL